MQSCRLIFYHLRIKSMISRGVSAFYTFEAITIDSGVRHSCWIVHGEEDRDRRDCANVEENIFGINNFGGKKKIVASSARPLKTALAAGAIISSSKFDDIIRAVRCRPSAQQLAPFKTRMRVHRGDDATISMFHRPRSPAVRSMSENTPTRR